MLGCCVGHLRLWPPQTTPARRQSCMCKMPIGRSGGPASSTTKTQRKGGVLVFMKETASAASALTRMVRGWADMRSEEHASELQSLMRSTYADLFLKNNKQSYNHEQHNRLL